MTQRASSFTFAASSTLLPVTRNEDDALNTQLNSLLPSASDSAEANNAFRFSFQPDIPITSIEHARLSHDPDVSDRSQQFRPRTPSFTITPSVSDSDFSSTQIRPRTPSLTVTPSGSKSDLSSTRRILTPKSRTRSPTPVSERLDDRSANLSPEQSSGPCRDSSTPVIDQIDDSLANLSLDQSSVPYRDSPTPSTIRRASRELRHETGYFDSSIRPSYPDAPVDDLSANDGILSSPKTKLLSPESEVTPKAHRRRSSASQHHASSPGDNSPHNVADEEPPKARFHEPEFQAAISAAEKVVQKLVAVLQSSPLHTDQESSLASLYSQANALRQFQHSGTRVVGLVGDSGVGKSSLINCLLDVRGLAQTGGSGSACTCVVTEYCYSEAETFVIEPEYFSSLELRTQLTGLLKSYRKYHKEPLGKDGDAEAFETVKKQAKLAEDMFRSAFKTYIGQDISFLLEDTESVVCNKLLSWAAQSGLDLPEDCQRSVKRQEFKNVGQCSAALRKLSSDSNEEHTNSIWPFIRKIK